MAKQLVCQYLENISREIWRKHPQIIKEYIRGRHGVYALYKKDKLYYVGLASKNSMARVMQHLTDRHGNAWDRFSVYLTLNNKHIKELESLVLRIAYPKGNKQKGRFYRAEDLKRAVLGQLSEFQKIEREGLFSSRKKKEEFKQRVMEEGRAPALKPYIKKGFRIRFDYKGKRYIAKVMENGKIKFKGELLNSPSSAGFLVTKRSTNGWAIWKYQRSPGEWVFINELRK